MFVICKLQSPIMMEFTTSVGHLLLYVHFIFMLKEHETINEASVAQSHCKPSETRIIPFMTFIWMIYQASHPPQHPLQEKRQPSVEVRHILLVKKGKPNPSSDEGMPTEGGWPHLFQSGFSELSKFLCLQRPIWLTIESYFEGGWYIYSLSKIKIQGMIVQEVSFDLRTLSVD